MEVAAAELFLVGIALIQCSCHYRATKSNVQNPLIRNNKWLHVQQLESAHLYYKDFSTGIESRIKTLVRRGPTVEQAKQDSLQILCFWALFMVLNLWWQIKDIFSMYPASCQERKEAKESRRQRNQCQQGSLIIKELQNLGFSLFFYTYIPLRKKQKVIIPSL